MNLATLKSLEDILKQNTKMILWIKFSCR